MGKRNLVTCFSPALYESSEYSNSIVVIIDVLRASSSICMAIANGASEIIPVAEVSEARAYKAKGYLVAAERDGYVLDFADFGNSPFNFTRERVKGKTIVYSTTNGTGIIKQASLAYKTVIGAFINIGALTDWLINEEKDAGDYKTSFDGINLASGIYVYRLTVGKNNLSRKMILLK